MRRSLLLRSLVLLAAAMPAASWAQDPEREPSGELWTPLAPVQTVRAPASPEAPPGQGERQRYRLNSSALERLLEVATREGVVSLPVPMPDGELPVFRVEESPILDPELAARFPEIHTYAGRDAAGATHVVRFAWTPLGFSAIVLSSDRVVFVEPEREDASLHVSYRYEPATGIPFECLLGAQAESALAPLDQPVLAPLVASGASRRTYRLAVAATGEYTQFFGGTVLLAMAGITNTVNAVNAIYNRDVGVNLVVVGNNNLVVYTDATTDPFPLSDLNAEVQAALDATIMDGNYDVGHVFHASGFSGNAGCIACVCNSGSKGSGFSQDATPNDGAFVFLVAHEMGHQHGGRHTWTGTGCNAAQWDQPASREPGSGTTIMSYSSICGADNVLGSQVGDLYFHADSRERIVNYTSVGGGTACGAAAATGNAVPSVNGGADYTIPQGTPFVLTASGSDADDPPGALTYAWEQYDVATARAALSAVDNGVIPLLRSFAPSSSPARTFPRFADLLAGAPSLFPTKLGEQLPATNRGLSFRVTVRDNRPSIGAADDDAVQLTVLGTPFTVDAPSGFNPLECGVSDTVQWTVGGGSIAPTVDIRLSTDGGASFPVLLASATANDGSEAVNVPATPSGSTRVRIDSVGNVFFNISGPTAIVDTLDPIPSCPSDVTVECIAPGGTPKTDPSLAAFFAGASASDACDSTPSLTNDAPPLFPVGTTPVSFTAGDDSGNAAACSADVTVEDTVPPTIAVSVTPTELWPPNHTLATITASIVVADVCEPNVAFELVSVTSDEPDDGLGDGDTSGDIQGAETGTADVTFQLRAERSGRGDGRDYTIVYRAIDGSGNWTPAVAHVIVPKSRGK